MPKKINTSAFLLAFGLTPERATQYLKDKGLALSWNVADMQRDAHDRAFTITKVTQADILQDVHDALTKAVESGQTFEDFRKGLKNTLATKGWWDEKTVTNPKTGETATVDLSNVRRLDNIYRTNLQNAMMAGRLSQQMESANERPFYQVRAIEDDRTTSTCRQINGKVFRYDDAAAPYPPFHFRCRTRAVSLSAKQAADRGLSVTKSKDMPKDNYGLEPSWMARPTVPAAPYKDYTAEIAGQLAKETKKAPRTVDEQEVDKLVDLAQKAGGDVEAFGKRLNDAVGGIRTPVDYKSKDSITRKVNDEYGGTFSTWKTKATREPGTKPNAITPQHVLKLKDSVRNTVILEPDDIEKALESVAADPNVVSLKRQSGPSFFGYTGNIINHKAANGMVVETQVNTAPIIYAKEKPADAKRILGEPLWNEIAKVVKVEGGKGHFFYEKIRVLDPVKDTKARDKWIKESEDYFAKFKGVKVKLK